MGSALGSALVYCIPAITALGLMRVQKKAAKSSGRPWKANGLEVLELVGPLHVLLLHFIFSFAHTHPLHSAPTGLVWCCFWPAWHNNYSPRVS
jgi:hypothetical protein